MTTIPQSALGSIPQGVKDVLANVSAYGSSVGITSEVAWTQTFLNPLIQKLQEGKTTSAEIAKAMQTKLEDVRKNG